MLQNTFQLMLQKPSFKGSKFWSREACYTMEVTRLSQIYFAFRFLLGGQIEYYVLEKSLKNIFMFQKVSLGNAHSVFECI